MQRPAAFAILSKGNQAKAARFPFVNLPWLKGTESSNSPRCIRSL
jgi:hypothetical protein